MRTLIIKLGATGDVLRTSPLLNVLPGEIDWVTSDGNIIMLEGNPKLQRGIAWSQASILIEFRYDLVVNLEDSWEAAQLLNRIQYKDLFGSYIDRSNQLTYTESSKDWFDLSLISKFGKDKADELKLRNRRSYQEIIFTALGYNFKGERYYLPKPIKTDLVGDVAISNTSGAVWPMKKWAYYQELKIRLESNGFRVNMLPTRPTILQHIADVQNHRYLVSGDSLPMHIALGSKIKCLTIFTCTSPWEIYEYGLQVKIISPKLEQYFYKRHFDAEAIILISLNEVYEKVLIELRRT